MFVCPLLPKVLPGNTPQYLSQIKSDLPKTFSILQVWSPALINNVRMCPHVRVHAQHIETCTHIYARCVRVRARINPNFFLVFPSYLHQHPTKFYKYSTSFILNMRVCFLPKVACMFSCAMRACLHVHAHKHY